MSKIFLLVRSNFKIPFSKDNKKKVEVKKQTNETHIPETAFKWVLSDSVTYLSQRLSSVFPMSVATQELSGIQLILLMLPIFYEPLKFSIEITGSSMTLQRRKLIFKEDRQCSAVSNLLIIFPNGFTWKQSYRFLKFSRFIWDSRCCC